MDTSDSSTGCQFDNDLLLYSILQSPLKFSEKTKKMKYMQTLISSVDVFKSVLVKCG